MEPEDEQFIIWLRTTLLRDLRESGQESTVEDFETMIRMAEKYAGRAEVAQT